MALRGNLKDFSLPDVFQLVTLSGKSGVLRIKRDDAEGSVWFRDGEVFFASSNWHHDLLGARLVAAAKITPSALARALDIKKLEPEGGRRLGQVLVDEGYISDKVLEAFVQEQIQDTIFDLFRWDEGDFDFEPLESAPEEDIGLSVSIENIVMEGSRRLEEWTRIKKKIPSMDIVFKMATAPGEGTFEISLKPVEWNLLLLVDGTRSVADLARQTGRTDFEVARVLYGLFSAGLLEVASDEEVERLRAEAERLAARRMKQAPASEPEPEPEPVPETAVPAPEVAVPAEAVPEAVPPEEPAFLSDAQNAATPEDLAVFEQMMGAVLRAPEAASVVLPEPVAAAEPEAEAIPELEVVAEPEPFVSVADEPPAPPVAEPGLEAVAEPVPGEAALPGVALEAELPPAPPVGEALEIVMPAEVGPPAALEVVSEVPAEQEPPLPPAVEPAEAALPVEIAEPEAVSAEELLEETFGVVSEPMSNVEAHPEIADVTTIPLGIEEAEEPVEWQPEEAMPDLSDLLSELQAEAPAEETEATASGDETAPATAEETLGGVISTETGEAEEPLEVISTDAFLSDFEAPSAPLAGGLADELTALTGGRRARPAASVARMPTESEAKVPHRDMMVDRGLVEEIIEGIKRL